MLKSRKQAIGRPKGKSPQNEDLKTSHKDNVPLLLFEGYNNVKIRRFAYQDNENDEYHVEVNPVNRWEDAWQATEEDGFTVDEAMVAIGIKRAQYFRLKKMWAKMPAGIKEKVSSMIHSETHCISLLDVEMPDEVKEKVQSTGLSQEHCILLLSCTMPDEVKEKVHSDKDWQFVRKVEKMRLSNCFCDVRRMMK